MALKLEIQTYQILTSDDEVCIPSPSSIPLAVYMYDIKEANPAPANPAPALVILL